MEEQFEALTKELAALAVVNQPQNCSPTLCFVEEDEVDYNVEDEMENPFLLDIEGGVRNPWFHTIQIDGNLGSN